MIPVQPRIRLPGAFSHLFDVLHLRFECLRHVDAIVDLEETSDARRAAFVAALMNDGERSADRLHVALHVRRHRRKLIFDAHLVEHVER
jgi:hypothetical protein